MRTKSTYRVTEELGEMEPAASGSESGELRRRSLLGSGSASELVDRLGARAVWARGSTGQGVRMGIFDTGIKVDHPHIRNIRERTNWTHEPTLEDGLGHGSFVAGVVAGQDAECAGLAPDVELFTFRVFTNDQVSYTSWFLDAFNYALATEMDILNLSIGGPDYLDAPFVDKVLEITSAGIVLLSAIGNDGPDTGTLNNPADAPDVIGVGGIDYEDALAPFSSRGMTTWELPRGIGRVKPDVVSYGRAVLGSRMAAGCTRLSGTSVASPVAAGAAALLASTLDPKRRRRLLSPASMKQALVEGAVRLPKLRSTEQGAGRVDVAASAEIMRAYEPRASLFPGDLDLTDCPYHWPHCAQPLYAGAAGLLYNATVLNGMGVVGWLGPALGACSSTGAAAEGCPAFEPGNELARLVRVDFEAPRMLWPWSGWLALRVTLPRGPRADAAEGVAEGELRFLVTSPPAAHEGGRAEEQRSWVRVRLRVAIAPRPPRERRLLWDQQHSLRYPPAYLPRDDLRVSGDVLDWHGDHPFTNFHGLFDRLRARGYFLHVLGEPLACFDAREFGALLVVDPEEEWYAAEVAKLEADVRSRGLGLLVAADWYHEPTLRSMRFYDDNTRSWWEAATGGANIPALNDLLAPMGAAFQGPPPLFGQVVLPGVDPYELRSSAEVGALPAGAWVHSAPLRAEGGSGEEMSKGVLGLFRHGLGHVALHPDSNCLDSSHSSGNCWGLLDALLEFVTTGRSHLLTEETRVNASWGSMENLPARRTDYDFASISQTLSEPMTCSGRFDDAVEDLKAAGTIAEPGLGVFSAQDKVGRQTAMRASPPILTGSSLASRASGSTKTLAVGGFALVLCLVLFFTFRRRKASLRRARVRTGSSQSSLGPRLRSG